jgi:hypothetical protein
MVKNEMVWSVENYTDKIHTGVSAVFTTYPWLTFTVSQMKEHISKGYHWLVVETPQQSQLLDKIVSTACKKLVQTGRIKKVTSKFSVDNQWMAVKGVESSSYTNVTGTTAVATTNEAKKAVGRRSIGARKLWELNHKA